MMNVQKKDGSMEPFDRNKIVMAVTSAGATTQEAAEVASGVEDWMPMAIALGTVSTNQIRGKVIELLKQLNPTANAVYEVYKG